MYNGILLKLDIPVPDCPQPGCEFWDCYVVELLDSLKNIITLSWQFYFSFVPTIFRNPY